MIGGKAPSAYLAQIQKNAQVQLGDPEMDDILKSHLVDPALLRADQFETFYQARKIALLAVVARAMGKPPTEVSAEVADDEDDDEPEDGAEGET
jgi:hypothetical protein